MEMRRSFWLDMARGKPFVEQIIQGAVVASFFAPLIIQAQEDRKERALERMAYELLYRALENKPRESYLAFRTEQRSGTYSLKLMIYMDSRGRKSAVVLQPLSFQGVLIIDNGLLLSTYYPDEKLILEQPSPSANSLPSRKRRSLIEQNYSVSLETSKKTVAGRETFMMTAVPKSSKMMSRSYYVDRRNLVVLRTETVDPYGKKDTILDTHSITFSDKFNKSPLEIPIAENIRRTRIEAPNRLRDLDQMEREVGFRVMLPDNLAYGFSVWSKDIYFQRSSIGKIDKIDKFVALRLSDGLAAVTIYLWNEEDASILLRKQFGKAYRHRKIGYAFAGEVPERVRHELIRDLNKILRESDEKSGNSLGSDRRSSATGKESDLPIPEWIVPPNDLADAKQSMTNKLRNLSRA